LEISGKKVKKVTGDLEPVWVLVLGMVEVLVSWYVVYAAIG
jgi:hypothetical protein